MKILLLSLFLSATCFGAELPNNAGRDPEKARRFLENFVESALPIWDALEKENVIRLDVSNFEKSAKAELQTKRYAGKASEKLLTQAYEVIAGEVKKKFKTDLLKLMRLGFDIKSENVTRIISLTELETEKKIPSIVDYLKDTLEFDASHILIVRTETTAIPTLGDCPAAKALSPLAGASEFSIELLFANTANSKAPLRFSGFVKVSLDGFDALTAAIYNAVFGSSQIILVHPKAFEKPVQQLGSILAHEAQHIYDTQKRPELYRTKNHQEEKARLSEEVNGPLKDQLFKLDYQKLSKLQEHQDLIEGWTIRWQTRTGKSREQLAKAGMDAEKIMREDYDSTVQFKYPYYHSTLETRAYVRQMGYLKRYYKDLSKEEIISSIRKSSNIPILLPQGVASIPQKLPNGRVVQLGPATYDPPFVTRFFEKTYEAVK